MKSINYFHKLKLLIKMFIYCTQTDAMEVIIKESDKVLLSFVDM